MEVLAVVRKMLRISFYILQHEIIHNPANYFFLINGIIFLYFCMFDAGGRETVSGHECKDSPYDWTDNFGRDCQFYADDPETVRRWGESNVSIDERLCHDVLNNHEGNNACCVCGGGDESNSSQNPSLSLSTMPSTVPNLIGSDDHHNGTCRDIAAWKDSFTSYGCSWYARSLAENFPNDSLMAMYSANNVTSCYLYGEKGFIDGYSAINACCVCSDSQGSRGGVMIDQVIVEENRNISKRDVYPNDLCIDYPRWRALDYTCSDYRIANGTIGVTCEKFGFLTNDHGASANLACCKYYHTTTYLS